MYAVRPPECPTDGGTAAAQACRGRHERPGGEVRVGSVPRQVFSFDPPDRFVAGTVGQPGERSFSLQASAGGRVTSVALEKLQAAALAERLGELLGEVRRQLGDQVEIPPEPPAELIDVAPLD